MHEISTAHKTKILKKKKIKIYLAFKLSDVVFIVLINVKMPTIVGNANNSWHFNIYEQDQFHGQLS